MKVWKKGNGDEEDESLGIGDSRRSFEKNRFFENIFNMNGRKKQGFDSSTEK